MVEGIQCCFCAKGIENGGLDPGTLIYVANHECKESEQQTQQFFCHAKCLRATLHSKTPLYVLED